MDSKNRPTGDIVPIHIKSGLSRSSSGNSVNSGSDYAVPRCQSFTMPPDRDPTPSSSEDSGSSCGSMQRTISKKGPLKGIHGLSMSKHASQDSIDQATVAQYATLRRSSSRKQSSQSLDFSGHGYPASPVSKCSNGSISPGLGSLPSPFANFKSPYAQIQSGEVKNQLHKDRRSSSVPSSPVTKVVTGQSSPRQVKQPPAPPKRTMSMKSGSVSVPVGDFSTTIGDEELLERHNFPPPLSPVAFNLDAMKATQPKSSVEYRTTSFTERRQSPARDALKLQNVTESSLAARRRASSAEKEANANNSNSWSSQEDKTPLQEQPKSISEIGKTDKGSGPRNSVESIPFANDNGGTIKQRGSQSRTALAAVDFIEDSFDRALESEETEESDFDYDTVKRMPKPGTVTD